MRQPVTQAQRPHPATCRPKAPLVERALLTDVQSGRLERLFKVLANGTRLRLLHALLRQPELHVGALADAVDMKPQAVSNQLQRLALSGIVAARRQGSHVRYEVVDPCVSGLLDLALCLEEDRGDSQAGLAREEAS